MVGSVLATLAALAAQAPQGAKAKADRSGEPALREMLAHIAAKRQFHGMVLKSHRDAGREDFYPEGVVEMWRDGEKFRVEFGDMWGTSKIVVFDGKRVLDDGGYDPVVLRKPGKIWTEASPVLDARGAASTPWFFLLEGPALLDRVDKDKSITLAPDSKSIVWDTTAFGRLIVRHLSEAKGLDVWELEFDNMPYQQEMNKLAPEWFDFPDPNAVSRHKIIIGSSRFRRGTFSTVVGKERQVSDQTQTPKKPPQL